eukprot:scaffold61142_cov57-Cyclotella_meneghiniana.AAC.11
MRFVVPSKTFDAILGASLFMALTPIDVSARIVGPSNIHDQESVDFLLDCESQRCECYLGCKDIDFDLWECQKCLYDAGCDGFDYTSCPTNVIENCTRANVDYKCAKKCDENYPDEGYPDEGYPYPDEGYPYPMYPYPGYPYPDEGYPYPDEGYPYPDEGYPYPMYPYPGYPYPDEGYPYPDEGHEQEQEQDPLELEHCQKECYSDSNEWLETCSCECRCRLRAFKYGHNYDDCVFDFECNGPVQELVE